MRGGTRFSCKLEQKTVKVEVFLVLTEKRQVGWERLGTLREGMTEEEEEAVRSLASIVGMEK